MFRRRERRIEPAPTSAVLDQLVNRRPPNQALLDELVQRNQRLDSEGTAYARGFSSMREGRPEEAYAYLKAAEHTQSQYSDLWRRWLTRGLRRTESQRRGQFDRELELFRQHLAGKTLVDLGSSQKMGMAPVAQALGVTTYIGVDRNFQPGQPFDPTADLASSIPPPDSGQTIWSATRELEVVAVQDDMLDFLSRVRDGSVSVSVNGIDSFIVGDPRYHQQLAAEITRVLEPGGLVLGLHSDVLEHLENEPTLNEIFTGATLADARVFTKTIA